MINILYIHQSAELYGSDRTLLSLVTRLDRSRYNPIVVLPCNGPLSDALVDAGITVIFTPVFKLHRNMFRLGYLLRLPFELLGSLRLIKKQLKGTQIHLVQSNTLATLLGVFVSRMFRAKHIWHVHEIIVHPKLVSNLYPKILNRYAHVVVCNSQATLQNLLERNQRLKPKLRLVYNGLDPAAYTVSTRNAQSFGFENEDLVIGLVGRISRLKGQQLLLKVFADNFSAWPHVKLLFSGSPVTGQEHYLHALEDKIVQYGLQNQVKIIPFQRSLAAVWALTDISVSPSTEAESFGLAALEAMYAKIPVVATNLGAFKEVVVDDETGILFENGNENALADALKRLLSDASLRRTMGQRGYQRAQSVFTMDAYVKGFTDIYEAMVF